MLRWFRRDNPQDAFFERFTERTVLVHQGFPDQWLEQLLKQPGGGRHLRLDIRLQTGADPTPVEWFVHQHLLPLDLPLPLVAQVGRDEVLVRHLVQRSRPLHPAELNWLLNEIGYRYHYRLQRQHGLQPVAGMDVRENELDYEI